LNRSIARFALLGVLFIVAVTLWLLSSRKQDVAASAPQIVKQAATVTRHTFDPAAPPVDMPPLVAPETAACDTNYISDASVSGRSRKLDATHAEVTVTGVKVTLALKINIWVPDGATQQVIEHEEGHQQISEHYYQDADKVAQQVAAEHIGETVSVSGSDLDAEINAALQKIGAEITAEYDRRLNPNAAQLRFDDITDHSRYDIAASDAVTRALKEN
jgi:hypothetical protein